MKKKLPLCCIIILITLFATYFSADKAKAIIPQGYYNVTSIVYYEDDALTTPITVNTQNLSNTPIVWHNMTGASAYRLSRFRFNLNGAAGLSRTRRILLSFELKVQMQHYAGTEVMGAFFSCPRGSGDLVVSECSITDLDGETTTWHTESLGNDDSGTYPILSNKNYTIDLVLYNKSDTAVNYNYIDTMSRFILFTNEELTKIAQVSWQIAFNNVAVFSYEQSDTIPYIEGATTEIENIKDLISDYIDNQEAEQEQEQEDRENIDQQQTDINEDAETSTQDMQSATTNITGVMSAFLTNLTNLNGNNCTLPEISAYGFSIGRLNLCTFRPPNWVQNVSSVIVSLLALGLAVHVFKRIMRIAKGLAGSK